MGKITRFEDLICWQKARSLVNQIYELTRRDDLHKGFALRAQIRRAAISSMTNIAEGFARFNKKEFIHFLNISQSSTEEVRSLLYTAMDQKYISKVEFEQCNALADEVRKTTLGLLRYIRSAFKKTSNAVKDSMVRYKTKNVNHSHELPNEFIQTLIP